MMKVITLSAFVIAASTQAADYHVAKHGAAGNAGSASHPLLTIQQAADLAQPGDTITVHEGVYRERVNPPRGGTSDAQRIVYQAAQGEDVVIKGSEVVTGWSKVKGGVWTVTLPNRFFGEFNPFADLIQGHWFDPKGREHHTGAVYLNGHWLVEAVDLESVLAAPEERAEPLWFAQVDERNTTIHAQFPGVDPNQELVEVNARRTVFYPDQPGRNYITVRGFTMTQAATSWSPPTMEQIGLVGTHWSKGWVIENNTINYSVCAGLTLGLSDMGEYLGNLTGYTRMINDAMGKGGWNKENVGSHLVRGNKISQCEQAGICGSLGGAFSVIENNEISYIHVRKLFQGQEQGGIKLHGAVDTVVRNNLVHDTPRALWLDWMGQGAEVSGNVAFNNSTDLYLEVNHGPALVANNILLSSLAVSSKSRGTAFVHNLFGGRLSAGTTTRTTPYLEPHGTVVAGYHGNHPGDDRYYNNIYVGKRPGYPMFVGEYNDLELPVTMQGNLYLRGEPYAAEVDPMVSNFRPDLTPVQKSDGIYLEWDAQAQWSEANRPLVTTELLGHAGVSGARFEQADGSPIRVDCDYLGNLRNEQNPAVGPFELPAVKVRLKIWPKESCSPPAVGAKTVKVFLLGGQSNMFGVGGVAADLEPPYNTPFRKVKIWNLNTNHWKPLSAKGSKFGPELSFGHTMAQAFPECDIRLVKYAASGTALYNDWAPTSGEQYQAFMSAARAALEDLHSNQVDFEIAGMLWLQGESDAHEKQGAEYQKNLTAFIEHMRTEFETLDMRFIIARVRDFYGKGAQAEMVRGAQEDVAERDENIEWFDTDDCGALVKGGHYASNGLIEIGKRFAEKFK